MTDPLVGIMASQAVLGGFRIFVSPPDGPRKEISTFRGAPIVPNTWSWGDPYSEEVATLSAPMITLFDTLGQGDLAWYVEGADVDIVWQPMPGSPITTPWTWEGYIASDDFGIDDDGASWNIQLRGAFFALDNYLAMPTFPAFPLPYEHLMRSAFDPEQHPCSLNPLDVRFPTWWNTYAPAAVEGENQLLRPAGVLTGSMWTGLTTRSTGSWNPLLTGFVSSLLQVMYNADGSQWTIRNRGSRSPMLVVREQASDLDPKVLNVDLGAPGVRCNLSRDYTQKVQAVYGTGTDAQGVNYNGMQMSANGQSISYVPFAYNPAVYPRSGGGKNNPLFNPQRKTRESYAAFQPGVTAAQAAAIASGQVQRLNDPGITGTITLTTDPYLSDGARSPFYRLLIRDGASIRVNGLFGVPEGVLFHVAEVQADATNLTTTLTVDTKYRDLLTVDEVNARTLDPLKQLHLLQNSAQGNQIQDLLMPWSYGNGSGSIPYGATPLYNAMPSSEAFPFSNDLSITGATKGWVQKFPPSKYPQYYVKIGPTDQENSANNWANFSSMTNNSQLPSIPILMSSVGDSSQIQVCAYDRDGNVMPVKFHISIYKSNGVTVQHMPLWTTNPYLTPPRFPDILGPLDYANAASDNFIGRWPGGAGGDPWAGAGVPYPQNDPTNLTQVYHPFFRGAWQTVDEQGHNFQVAGGIQVPYAPDSSVDMIIGWGTYYVPAGFWPGQPGGAPITGQLVDTVPWHWDTTSSLNSQSINPVANAPTTGGGVANAGRLFAMIYCEDQGQKDVYFLGRIFAQSQNGQ